MSMEQKKHQKEDQLANIFKNQAVQSKYRVPMPVSRESVRKQQLAGAQFLTRTTTAENQTSIQASIERYQNNLQQSHQRHQSNLRPLGQGRNVPLTVVHNHSLQTKQPLTAVETHQHTKLQNSLNPSLQMLNEQAGSSSAKGAKWVRRDVIGVVSPDRGGQKQGSEEKRAARKLSKSLKFPMDIEKLNSLKSKERQERKLFNEQFDSFSAQKLSITNLTIEQRQLTRRFNDQLQDQIKEVQKLIKEKKKQIQAQLAENDQVEQKLQDQLDLNYRLMNSDMMKAHMSKTQTSVDLNTTQQSNEQLQQATFNNSLESPRQAQQSVNNTSRSLFMQFYENDLT